jgi:DNA mismatch repair protein MutL
VFGKEIARAMITAEGESGGLSISAFLSLPDLSRAKGDQIYFYVNGRNVRDRMLSRALMEGYGHRLMKGRFPYAVVFLELNPSEVDVNVHPAKQEVRFRKGEEIFKTVVSVLNTAMTPRVSRSRADVEFGITTSRFTGEDFPWHKVAEPAHLLSTPSSPPRVLSSPESPGAQTRKDLPISILGQLGAVYILCETAEGLLILDQHAAHERIAYETLKKGFESSKIEVQHLLMPLHLEVSARERDILSNHIEGLSRVGIEIEYFGGSTFLLHAVPALLADTDWQAFLGDFLAECGERGADTFDFFDKALVMMACHGTLRRGEKMTSEEMQSLVTQLFQTELPTNCPHGRPVFKQLSYHELNKIFKRVV